MSRPLCWCIVVTCVLGFAWPSQAQCPDDESWWGYSSLRSLHVPAAGPGLLTSGQTLVTFDAADPEAPRVLGQGWVGAYASVLALMDNLAVVGSIANGIQLVNVADPEAPEPVGRMDIDHVFRAVVLTEHAVALAVGEELWLADLTDPGAPRLGARLDLHGRVDDLERAGELVAVANGAGLVMVDSRDLEHPSVVSELALPGYCNRVVVGGDRAYLSTSSPGAVYEVDISDPAAPVLRHTVSCPDWSRGMEMVGETSLVIAGETALLIYNLSSQDGPEFSRVFIPEKAPSEISARGDILWMAASTGEVSAIEVPAATAPLLRGSFELPLVAPVDVAVDEDLVLVADGIGPRLRVLMAEEGEQPEEIAVLDLPGNTTWAVAALGDLALVSYGSCEWGEFGPSCEDDGLAFVDLSTPAEPELELLWEGLPGMAEQILMGDGFALLEGSGWQLVDLSDPLQPRHVAELEPARALSLDDRTVAYLPLYGAELCTVDLTQLDAPVQLGCLELEGYPQDVALEGDLAAVAVSHLDVLDNGPPSLQFFDVSDPASPILVGSRETWNSVKHVLLRGDRALVDTGIQVLVFDVSEPAAPLLDGYAECLAAVDLERMGERVVVAYDDGVRTLDLGACGSSPPQADFAWSPALPALGEPVEFAERCAATPTGFWWDFGDGSSTTESDPSHVFSVPGEHEVQLTVTNDFGSASVAKTIATRTIATDAEFVALIPAAAQAPGYGGTAWRTELVLGRVPDVPTSAEALLFFMPRDQDNTLASGHRVQINRLLRLDDVVGGVLDNAGGVGAIKVVSNERLQLTSRTYTQDGNGTYGQLVPPVLVDSAVRGGQAARLLLLESTSGFRSNLGMVNFGPVRTGVVVDFYDGDGVKLGSTTRTLAPFSSIQINKVLQRLTDEPVPQAYAVLQALDPEAEVAFYASVVDNLSGDPGFSEPVFPSSEPLFIPAVAHIQGANGTEWRSLLQLCAVEQAHGTVSLLPDTARPGAPRPTVEFELEAGHCLRSADAVAELFGEARTGALRIVPASGSIVASSRTYTLSEHGSYGQLIPAVRAADVPVETTFVGLRESDDPSRGFRTNVGFLNVTDRTANVVLLLHGQDWQVLRRYELELLPYTWRQLDRVLSDLGGVDLAWAELRQAEFGGDDRVVVYGSVVDNTSGDPSFLKGW